MTQPMLSLVKSDEITVVETQDGVRVKILAGNFGGKKSTVKTFTPVLFYHVHLPAGNSIEIPVPQNFNLFAYGMAGSGTVGEQKTLSLGELALFKNDGESVLLSAQQDKSVDIVLLGGEPLNEPVVTYGPFVMNTEGELRQTFLDYQSGKFGKITV
jgi:redox-sensitive bicupin YhaK (pirin superfamily)